MQIGGYVATMTTRSLCMSWRSAFIACWIFLPSPKASFIKSCDHPIWSTSRSHSRDMTAFMCCIHMRQVGCLWGLLTVRLVLQHKQQLLVPFGQIPSLTYTDTLRLSPCKRRFFQTDGPHGATGSADEVEFRSSSIAEVHVHWA